MYIGVPGWEKNVNLSSRYNFKISWKFKKNAQKLSIFYRKCMCLVKSQITLEIGKGLNFKILKGQDRLDEGKSLSDICMRLSFLYSDVVQVSHTFLGGYINFRRLDRSQSLPDLRSWSFSDGVRISQGYLMIRYFSVIHELFGKRTLVQHK